MPGKTKKQKPDEPQANPDDSKVVTERVAVQGKTYHFSCVGCGKEQDFKITDAFKEAGTITVEAVCPGCNNTIVETLPEDQASRRIL